MKDKRKKFGIKKRPQDIKQVKRVDEIKLGLMELIAIALSSAAIAAFIFVSNIGGFGGL